MEELELPYFDVVVCNLYPFEENNTIENIDMRSFIDVQVQKLQ